MSGTAFVTGATGFLGCWIVKRLVEAGWRVGAFDRALNFERVHLVLGQLPMDNVTWMRGDIVDMESLQQAMERSRPDVVLHLAAALIPFCRVQPAAAASINVTGHINVFEAARNLGLQRIVYASSTASRSRTERGILSTAYGTFKLWSEEYAAVYFDQHGVSSFGLRPDIVYGPGRQSGETAFVSAAIADVADGRSHLIKRRWSMRLEYVEEVADAFFRCAASTFEGAYRSDVTAQVTNERDLIQALREAVADCRVMCQPTEPFLSSPAADLSSINAIVGDGLHVPLVEGVRRTIEWIRTAKAPQTPGMVDAKSRHSTI